MNRKYELADELLLNIKVRKEELESLYEKITSSFCEQNYIYRYYHHSYKSYYVQDSTIEVYELLKSLMPEIEVNSRVKTFIEKGTGKKFDMEHNKDWEKHVAPMIYAYFQMKFLLEQAIKYSTLKKAPELLPFGWGALLYFYCLR